MSLSAAVIEALVGKGLSAQDILDIAKASEAKIDHTAAERQARHRAKKRVKRNAVTSRRDPLIEDHNPGSQISSSDETENDCAIRDDDWPDLPDWLPAKPWNAYLEMRRTNRKWPTADGVELMLGKLDRWRGKGHDPTEILNNSTENTWTGLFEPKDRKNGTSFKPRASVREIAERALAGRTGPGDSAPQLLPGPRSAGGYG